jgi:hypothetical protein
MTVIAKRGTVPVPVRVRRYLELTESAYELWVDGRLLEELGIRDDGRSRVEIIGGEILVSPGPLFHQVRIITDIHDAFTLARSGDSECPWRSLQNMDFNLRHIGDGYVPDLIVLSVDEYEDPSNADARNLIAEQIGMAVEITSKPTASTDREPDSDRERWTKWNGYAHEGVEFYLLVDRGPEAGCVSLFSEPDLPDGVYRRRERWMFGETVVLPEPFGIEIPTEGWQPWDE